MSALTFRGVTKRFGGGPPVLTGLSAEIPLTGITFVVGKSGSGKSVLCRLAVGLLQHDVGEVTLRSQRIDVLPERSLREVRAKVPYLVQGPALLDWLTLEDNAALTSKGSKHDGRAAAALERVGLGELKDRFPPEVGPGIKKRCAIARALVLQPDYLLLDEPTTGLDRTAAAQVNETLAQLRRDGLGALVVSHDYRALEAFADRVLEVREGVTGFNGPASDFRGLE